MRTINQVQMHPVQHMFHHDTYQHHYKVYIQLGSLLVTALHRSVFVDFNHGQQLLGDEFA